MNGDDWTIADTDTSAAILLYLGIGSEASKEPFIDRRRDAIARIIRARVDYEIAQEREKCAFAADEPNDCIHVSKEIKARLIAPADIRQVAGADLPEAPSAPPSREYLARAIHPDAWRQHDTLIGFFERNVGANEHQETYGRMYRAGIRTASEASAWILTDEVGWRLQDSLRHADSVIGALARITEPRS
ncbi:hypothetical protein G6L37_00945 [Agrobacterium rubi]|nr:hypothetical protein [Agrobacterium rubi]NTF23958.1 hypothetical protein [Agrobacterium rubi]